MKQKITRYQMLGIAVLVLMLLMLFGIWAMMFNLF
jgi:hypothetical protein